MPNCILCNNKSTVKMKDHIKICSECYSKAVEDEMDLDNPAEYFLCLACDRVYHIEVIGSTVKNRSTCKYCEESELKNGTID